MHDVQYEEEPGHEQARGQGVFWIPSNPGDIGLFAHIFGRSPSGIGSQVCVGEERAIAQALRAWGI